uniref:BRCT domain-containing protein n=1 Tax=Leersia perrieri TaxID=77586 RepID=A0A0D9WHX9_9ORYZ
MMKEEPIEFEAAARRKRESHAPAVAVADQVNCYLMCPEHATEILQSDKINSPIEETGNSSSFPQSPLSIEQGTFADCEREDHRIDQRNTSSYFPQGEISAKGVSAVQNSEMDKLNTSCSSFPQGQDKDVISTNDRRKEKQKDHLCAERNCSSDQWVLLGSALSASEKEFASWTGATVVIEWTENVTHVIVGRSVGSAWSRSYEVLMALLFGKWIVTRIMDFLVKFTASPETTFELRFSHNSHTSIDGNNKRRNQASEGAQKLFSGLNFCLSAYMNPDNRQHIESLIGAAGGQILEISGSHSLWGKNANLEKPLYFVYNGGFVYHGGAPSEFTARLLDDLSKELGESVEYAAHGARVISNLKLFDAIAAYDAQILNHKG